MMMLRAAGVFLIALGIIWGLQGFGLLNWPASSFMIDQRQWAFYGVLMALVGAVLLWLAGRRGRPR